MSTAARKARKQARRNYSFPKVNTENEVHSAMLLPFQHPVKVGTPVEQRAENRPRGSAFDPLLPSSRSVRARRRIEARS